METGEGNGDTWGLMYHLLMSTYGWTIGEVDRLTLPQAIMLVQSMGRMEQVRVKAAARPQEEAVKAREARLDQALGRLGDSVEVVPSGKPVVSRTGSKIHSLTVIKTGKRLI